MRTPFLCVLGMEADDHYNPPHSSPSPQQKWLESEWNFLECLLLESIDS